MMTLSPSLPAVPTDNALTYALTLLAVAADPNGTRERLDQLVGQITAIHAAVAEYDAAAAKAAEVAAAQEAVTTKAAEVASRGESLLKANTQLSVANHADASREESLNAREQTLDRRQAELDAKEKALAAKAEQWRAALA